jgi:putative glutamine amidotransferase
MKRPRILIPLPAYDDLIPPKYGVKQAYTHAVACGGGEPLCVIRPDNERLIELLPFVDGIFIVGGHDIDSEYYGEENSDHVQNIDRGRDQVELTLVRLAVERRIPLFGICRGMQAMNVALGGSLYQDIGNEMIGALHHDYHKDRVTGKDLAHDFLAHDISIREGTLLARLTKKEKLAVNSLHHQGVKALGKDLVASAHAPDGLIEAIELPDHPFALGVEWHPEELHDEASQKIFSAFIDAAMIRV